MAGKDPAEGVTSSRGSLSLRIAAGPHAGQKFQFGKATITIGRSPLNDVCLAHDSAVSGSHARMTRVHGEWFLEDRNSKNGTFKQIGKRQHRIKGRVRVTPGEVIVLGRSKLKVEFMGVPPGDSQPGLLPASTRSDTQLSMFKAALPGALPTRVGAKSTSRRGTEQAKDRSRRSGVARRTEPLVLRVDHEADSLKYQMVSRAAYASEYVHPYCESDLQDIEAQVRAAFQEASSDAGQPTADWFERFRDVGLALRDRLLPWSIQKRLDRACRLDLLLQHKMSLAYIPWELVSLGKNEFLSVKFNLGRQVLIEGYSTFSHAPRVRALERVLFVCDPTGDFPEAREATQALYQTLTRARPNLNLEFLAGPRVTRTELLTRFAQSDMVYFIGHAEHDADNPSNSGWPLKKGRITCADIRTVTSPPRFVFANGCETAREDGGEPDLDLNRGSSGMASACILSGVEGYVGSVWPVPPQAALVFAEVFFTHLVDNCPVGECVRRARVAVGREGGRHAAAWAAFVFYGDPLLRLT
ncbi:MAG: CHAT domain-containing protein [Candidatus Hydrogenedentes bacterium]|nr:CHAT domain-containing protein [Candidatus Hydrogenedentota bacterium]